MRWARKSKTEKDKAVLIDIARTLTSGDLPGGHRGKEPHRGTPQFLPARLLTPGARVAIAQAARQI